jgi:hypothetical protein
MDLKLKTLLTETSAMRRASPAQRQPWGSPPPPQGWYAYLAFTLLSLNAFSLLMVALLSGMAWAQAAAGAPAPADVDPMQLLQAIFDGVHNGNGWLAAGPALALVVWALRKYDTKIPVIGPKVDAFLNQPLVAFLLPAVLSAAMGLFGALAQHLPIGAALLTALKVAGAAAFTFLAAKNAAEQVKGAQVAGAAAAKDPGPTLGA